MLPDGVPELAFGKFPVSALFLGLLSNASNARLDSLHVSVASRGRGAARGSAQREDHCCSEYAEDHHL
jgi:hypothetical protein